ncbi:MAG: uracil-DNA glycosylase [Armatimonadaceae bacterium]
MVRLDTDLPPDWRAAVGPFLPPDLSERLRVWLDEEAARGPVLPPAGQVFAAFHETPWESVRVVLIGQDPYPTPGHAHGLAFSVTPSTRPIPPSLRNLFRELHSDIGASLPSSGSLLPWARQGVLLLNRVLTVRAGEARSHAGRGWEAFTDAVVDALTAREAPVVFLLLGKDAQSMECRVLAPHRVVCAPHPSPLARNPVTKQAAVFGTKPFSRVNDALVASGLPPIDWALPSGLF